MGLKKYRLFVESAASEEYIMGIPSGEILFIGASILNKIKEIVEWKYSVKNSESEFITVNCYCFEDEDRDKILNYINYIEKSIKKHEDFKDYDLIKIAEDFQEEYSKTFNGRKVNIGYLDNYGIQFYYAIFPDLIMNKKYYDSKKKKMNDVLISMKNKYPSGVFMYVPKMIDKRVKYLRDY